MKLNVSLVIIYLSNVLSFKISQSIAKYIVQIKTCLWHTRRPTKSTWTKQQIKLATPNIGGLFEGANRNRTHGKG